MNERTAETVQADRCRAIITMQSPQAPISLFRCEKPLHHGGQHYTTTGGPRPGGMAWPEVSPSTGT
jgi:hypothetical protein